VARLRQAGIEVSLFLDPDPKQIALADQLGAAGVELHTGAYSLAKGKDRDEQLKLLHEAAAAIVTAGMTLHAGHGLNYQNVRPVAAIPHMCELNIGHSIVARAIMVGMEQAVREMKRLIAG
jgi:pyridoxine 5-phosphate synthase